MPLLIPGFLKRADKRFKAAWIKLAEKSSLFAKD